MIELRSLRHRWRPKAPLAESPWVLDIEQFTLGAGEQLFLAGPSGSGKSTLLAVVSGVVAATEGTVRVLGEDLARLPAGRRDSLRANGMGVIFQLFNLLPYLDALDNVQLAGQFAPARHARARARSGTARGEAERLLTALRLAPQHWRQPAGELSVGQQQRVAAARALYGGPQLVIADEPTSALDADTRDGFIALLQSETRAAGAGLLFVSHDRALATRFDRVLELGDINRAATPGRADVGPGAALAAIPDERGG